VTQEISVGTIQCRYQRQREADDYYVTRSKSYLVGHYHESVSSSHTA
jgi:hypothetical protein